MYTHTLNGQKIFAMAEISQAQVITDFLWTIFFLSCVISSCHQITPGFRSNHKYLQWLKLVVAMSLGPSPPVHILHIPPTYLGRPLGLISPD